MHLLEHFGVAVGNLVWFPVIPVFFVISYYVSRANFKRWYMNALSPLSHKVYMPFAIGIEIIDDGVERFLRY